MRILIIDGSRQFMGRVRLLASGLPDVEVTEYDAVERGLPDGEFDWALYDRLVMTLELGSAWPSRRSAARASCIVISSPAI